MSLCNCNFHLYNIRKYIDFDRKDPKYIEEKLNTNDEGKKTICGNCPHQNKTCHITGLLQTFNGNFK